MSGKRRETNSDYNYHCPEFWSRRYWMNYIIRQFTVQVMYINEICLSCPFLGYDRSACETSCSDVRANNVSKPAPKKGGKSQPFLYTEKYNPLNLSFQIYRCQETSHDSWVAFRISLIILGKRAKWANVFSVHLDIWQEWCKDEVSHWVTIKLLVSPSRGLSNDYQCTTTYTTTHFFTPWQALYHLIWRIYKSLAPADRNVRRTSQVQEPVVREKMMKRLSKIHAQVKVFNIASISR